MRPGHWIFGAVMLGVTATAVPLRAQEAHARVTIVAPRAGEPVLARALAAARAGDTIRLQAGTYREPTIVIDRAVTLVGDEGATIESPDGRTSVLVTADRVTITGLRFTGVLPSHTEDRAAIRVERADACRIAGNRIENAFFGVYLSRTNGCVVEDNRVIAGGGSESRAGNAVHVYASSDTHIRRNYLSGHRDGVYLEFARGSVIEDNVAERNVRYGLHFMSADESVYERNVFRRNHAGVAVMYSKQVRMLQNRFEQNWGNASYGLLLKEITDAELLDNHFEGNTTAVLADGATRLHAEGNHFVRNGWAVRLMASSDAARFTGNSFLGNSFDVSTNSRQVHSTFSGNYWDAYRGYDLDRDGIGDVPHRPMRLFALVVERIEPSMLLLRSFIVGLLDAAERVMPSLTPAALADHEPLMRRPR